MTTWPTERITELLTQITLTRGHHTNGIEACAMDLIGMATDGKWTDTPSCVHPILAKAVHRINDDPDTSTEERLSLVLDAGPHLIGTNDKTHTPWAVMVAHRAGRTAPGLVAALATTPPRVNLTGANLARADLARADLAGANLARANLTGANLTGANLTGANLTWADLTWADLTRANLAGANLTWADLARANLTGANLTEAVGLDNAKNVPAETLAAWETVAQ